MVTTLKQGRETAPGSSRLADYAGSRDNNFNLIRLLAASLVIVSHSYVLALGQGHHDPLLCISGCVDLGTLAVDIFFVISGFLVAGSLFARKNVVAFAWARVLRIYPALIVVVLFCILVVGPLFTTKALNNYFSDSGLLLFFAKSGSLLWKPAYRLPGVFPANPYPDVVNGSLWTLPWELRMYGLLAILWLAFRFNFSRAVAVLVAVAVLMTLAITVLDLNVSRYLREGFRFIAFFFMGAFYFIHRDKVAMSKTIAVSLAVLLFSSLLVGKSLSYICYVFSLPYLVFATAYLPGGIIRKFNRLGDYSYGVYIFAFPVQQAIITMIPGIGVWRLIVSAWLVTMVFAVLSWHLVEKPCLRQKNNQKLLERLAIRLGFSGYSSRGKRLAGH